MTDANEQTDRRHVLWPTIIAIVIAIIIVVWVARQRPGQQYLNDDLYDAARDGAETPAVEPDEFPVLGEGAEDRGPATAASQAARSQPATAAKKRAAPAPAVPDWAAKPAPRQDERDAMVHKLRYSYGLKDKSILTVMSQVPRHEFVPMSRSHRAYADTPLPIGFGQTISQPYIVAEMTRQLKLKSDSKVLEIGTGSGYQAAVLAHITPNVYTVEILKPLAQVASKRLKRLGYGAVAARLGDGYFGWAARAPFDAIIVTCAAGQIPPPLLKQLRSGGRMIIPVGSPFAIQSLMLIEKDNKGVVRSRSLMSVRFVPLLRSPTSKK